MDTELALLAGRGDSGLGPAPGAQARLALRLAGSGLLIAVEVAAFAALAGLAAMPAERGRAGGRLLARLRAGVVGASIAVVSVVALAVLGASVAEVTASG